jgi:5'-nucleotidase
VQRLDPAIATVISGHTHWAYVCRSAEQAGAGRLLTSAGKYGYFITDLRLKFDAVTHRLASQEAHNIVVGNGERGEDPDIRNLVARYAVAVAPIANRIVGHLNTPAPNAEDDGESPAADLIADSMLAATRGDGNGGAQLALLNATGVRVPLPAGDIKYAAAFEMMPFGNSLVTMTLTGAQLKAVIEQQYSLARPAPGQRPQALATSEGFTYAVDMRQPAGRRVFDIRLNGRPIDPDARYRIVVNNYLASGGDGLTAFTKGTDFTDRQILDLDALVAWIAPGRTPPKPNRIFIDG